MKQNRVISTAVLLLLLGAAIPAIAQKGEEEKGGGGGKAQPAQHEAQPQQHAQKAQPQQRAQKAQPQQRAQKAQPQQRAQKAQPQQRAQQAQRQQPQRTQQAKQSGRQQGQTVASNSGGGHYGRISDTSYRAHFGHEHSFRMKRPRMINGYNRFQYGGYWFGFNQGWPVGWSYDDTVYVEYSDGAYYLCDLRFPGVQITLNMF
jgi:hypothetical protein